MKKESVSTRQESHVIAVFDFLKPSCNYDYFPNLNQLQLR
jgi:hypothetical protein